MRIENDTESAFPRQISSYTDREFGTTREYVMQPATGLSKREYFAAKAMQGICSSHDECGELIRHGAKWIAKEAVAIADALIAELNKETKE